MANTCPICSQSFTSKRETKEYCSTECRLLAYALRKLTALGWKVNRA